MTRRRLLQAGAVASVALLGLDVLEGAAAASTVVPSYLRRASFTPLAGQSVASSAGSLTLDAVGDVEDASLAGRDDVFVLSLSGPQHPVLAQGIQQLSHPQLGAFAMFVVPIDDPTSRQRYEVTVDRSVRSATAQSDAPAPGADRPGAVATSVPAALRPGAAGGAGKPRTPLLLSAHLARRAGQLSVDLRLAPDRQVVAVRVSLQRVDRALARGSHRVDGGHAVRVPLREPRRVGPGRYELLVTTTDRLGRHASERRAIRLG